MPSPLAGEGWRGVRDHGGLEGGKQWCEESCRPACQGHKENPSLIFWERYLSWNSVLLANMLLSACLKKKYQLVKATKKTPLFSESDPFHETVFCWLTCCCQRVWKRNTSLSRLQRKPLSDILINSFFSFVSWHAFVSVFVGEVRACIKRRITLFCTNFLQLLVQTQFDPLVELLRINGKF